MPSPNQKSRRSGSLTMASTGAAVRRGELKISDPIPFDDGGLTFNSPNTVPHSSYHHAVNDSTWPRKSVPAENAHVRHVSDIPRHHGARASAGPSLLQGSMSSIPSKGSLVQRKPGGLRGVIKRMFSSKKHRSAPMSPGGLEHPISGQLHSVAEHQVRTRLDSAPSLGANFAARGAALNSHAQSDQQPGTVYQSLPPPVRRGRRNTLPSLVFSDKESGIEQTIDWPTAGMAHLDSGAKDDRNTEHQFKRRSRSADALNELIQQGTVERTSSRDRAGTIAFWRNSAVQDPIPVYSGEFMSADSTRVHSLVTTTPGFSQQVSQMSPMQTFDFGLGSHDRDETSLEQRLGTLEIKIFDFEFALAKLQGHDIPNPRARPTPFNRGSVHNIFRPNETNLTLTSGSSNPPFFTPSSAETPQTFLSSPGESELPSPEAEDMFRPQRASKATTVTIRPDSARRKSSPHSRVSSRSSIHIPAHKFEALLDLVKEEKAARLRLEEQVQQLQKEMESLRAPVYATIREAYPTPSPGSSQHSPNAPRVKTLHRTQPFSLEHNPVREVSRFSGTEDSDGDDDEDAYEDVYQTPKEEQRNTFETARGSPRTITT